MQIVTEEFGSGVLIALKYNISYRVVPDQFLEFNFPFIAVLFYKC